jgi:excinuclease UvrABC nuclease subunit
MERLVHELEKEMRTAAQALEFEKAAMLRDQVYELRGALEEERVTRASPGTRLSPEGAESGPPERGRPRRRARASTR